MGVQAYALTHAVKSKITPSHLSRISQGVLVGLVGQVGQEVQFFHNLVSQVGQVTLEVLWVQQLNPLLVPISDKKDFFECIGSTTAGPPSLVATFSNGLPPHRCSQGAWILIVNEKFDHLLNYIKEFVFQKAFWKFSHLFWSCWYLQNSCPGFQLMLRLLALMC